MPLNIFPFHLVETPAPERLPFLVREEVFCCTLQDYLDNPDTLKFEPTALEPLPPLDYVRTSWGGEVVSVIRPAEITGHGLADPRKTLDGHSFHYGELNTVFCTRKIRTYIPLFKFQKIVSTTYLVDPDEMRRRDIPTKRYAGDRGIAWVNTGVEDPNGDFVKICFDFGSGNEVFVIEYLDQRE